MKLIKKFLGIAAIIAVIGFMALPLTGCPEESDEGKKNVTPSDTPDTSGDPIESILISIPAPAKDVIPAKKAILNPADNFTSGDITWTPAPSSAGKFEGGKEYTAKVRLTAKDGYTFYGLTKEDVKINEENVTTFTNNAKTVDLSYKFPTTDNRTVTGITIKNEPTKLTYNYNEALDLSNLQVSITYDSGAADDVLFSEKNFALKSLTTDPINGFPMSVVDHNGKPVKIQHGNGVTVANTQDLTVNPIAPATDNFTINGAVQTYDGSSKSVTVSAKPSITGMGSVSNIQYEGTEGTSYTKSTTAPTNAGKYTITVDVTKSVNSNYDTLVNLVVGTFTINKATPVAGNFNISGANATYDFENGIARTVTVTVKDGIQGMGTVTVKYNGNSTAVIGTYTVTFDVAAGTNYTEAENFPAGTLTINFKTPTLTTIDELSSLLTALPANTADTAYSIILNLSELSSLNTRGKYLNIDLSGSTLTYFSRVFSDSNLVSITLPNTINNIWEMTFIHCPSLPSITIPASVTTIGNYAFHDCPSLTSVTFATGSNIPDANFGTNVFPEGSEGNGGNSLKTAYSIGKAGTYTRAANGSTWSKQN
ncbi:MAG: leucine-rich repeat protein [Treponema sp.]|jgi:hypothetical protein|nr:leucine-rich repeat protein [Treponema sp.]